MLVADNIEQAISYYQQALSVTTQQAWPIERAETMNNQGNAYYSRIKKKRANNIEQAISCYQQALSVRTQQALPIEWAQTMNNLAIAYQ
mgnify:CR=1 FL=1